MARIIHVTLPDAIHDLLIKIQLEKGFSNQAEALEWVIKKAAGVEA